jgi:hypothetical protein
MVDLERNIIRNYNPIKIIQVPQIDSVEDIRNLYYEAEPGSKKIYIASELADIIRKLDLTLKEDSTFLAKLLIETCQYFDRPIIGLCNIHPLIESEDDFRRLYQADPIITILRVAKLL